MFLESLEPFAERTFAGIRDLDAASFGLMPARITRRNVKTVRSIVSKLRRQTTKLSQIQDLVGCRIVTRDSIDQAEWLRKLVKMYPTAQVVDRTIETSNGYRAKHLIVRDGNRRFEIQLRSFLEDRWANVVEKIADRSGIEVKYGGGDPRVRDLLLKLAQGIAEVEILEAWQQARPEQWSLDGTFGMRFSLIDVAEALNGSSDQEMERIKAEVQIYLACYRPIEPGSYVVLGQETTGRFARARVEQRIFAHTEPEADDHGFDLYHYLLDLERGATLPNMISAIEVHELRSDIEERIEAIEKLFV